MTTSKQDASVSKGPAKRRPRRSSDEVIGRLIDAAVVEFGIHGYAGARTASIAKRADVVEPLLFKYFGSKANLFQRAIFEPLNANYLEFQRRYNREDQSQQDLLKRSREYITHQQEFLQKHSRMFMSLVLSETFNSGEFEGLSEVNGLQQYLDNMVRIVEARLTRLPKIQPKLLARISFATLLSCVLFRDWLFPDGIATDDEIRNAVIDFIMEAANPATNGGSPA